MNNIPDTLQELVEMIAELELMKRPNLIKKAVKDQPASPQVIKGVQDLKNIIEGDKK